jgi:hypothetical protein
LAQLISLKRIEAMKTDRFSYETSRWAGNQPEQAKRWFDELEMIGPQNVRARLAQTDAGSAGAIAIGSIPYLTIGFAQEWLAWHDQKREALEARRHNREVFWTRFAALAATVAAAAAVFGVLWTIFHKAAP